MKKLVALLLSLCVLFSLSAVLAEDNTKSVEASYTVQNPTADGVEQYSLTMAWNVGKADIQKVGAVYTWDADTLSYTEKTAAYHTGSANISVTITNKGNKAARCTLSFAPIAGITASFIQKTDTIASAAEDFDPQNPTAKGTAKILTLNGTVSIDDVADSILNGDGFSADSFTIGTATLSISDITD